MVLRKRGLAKREPELEMAPMIDVVFLLLVFFMVTSTFRQFETQLRSAMTEQKPDAGPHAKADFENVIQLQTAAEVRTYILGRMKGLLPEMEGKRYLDA